MLSFHILLPGYRLKKKRELRIWLNDVVRNEQKITGQIDIILCDDEHLLRLNQKHLHHDYYTDIITFNYTECNDLISGDLYISLERVRENALKYKVTLQAELHRVMVHGILHLLGYSDGNLNEKTEMRKLEDRYLKSSPCSEKT